MTMAFAIDEINKNSNLVPNVTLGYSLYDNCATLVIGFSAALLLASGQEEQFLLQEECLGTPPVLGIVGDSFSTFSIATSDVLGLFNLPIVSSPSSVLLIAELLMCHICMYLALYNDRTGDIHSFSAPASPTSLYLVRRKDILNLDLKKGNC